MARRNKLSEQDKTEIRELYAIDKVKYTKYRLAVMYGVDWSTIHRTIDEPARIKNIKLTNERTKRKRNGEL